MSRPPITTADALYAHPEHERYELVRGDLRVCEPPGGVHGRLATRLAYLLHAHVERYRLGTVLVEAGYVLTQGPDTVRGPDISFVSEARIKPEQIPEAFIQGTPDLAVEIGSPDDRASEVNGMVTDYLNAGARAVWVVDPRQHRVAVHLPGRPTVWLGEGDWLDGEDIVPGFRCAVAEVFGRR